MSVEHINGDLLALADDGQFTAIMHGCNCQHIMGAGIAKQIKQKYPEAFEIEARLPLRCSLGWFNVVNVDELDIYNLYTQPTTGNTFDIAAFQSAFRKAVYDHVLRQVTDHPRIESARIGIPHIGCGLGGGNWNDVLGVIETVYKDFETHKQTNNLEFNLSIVVVEFD